MEKAVSIIMAILLSGCAPFPRIGEETQIQALEIQLIVPKTNVNPCEPSGPILYQDSAQPYISDQLGTSGKKDITSHFP